MKRNSTFVFALVIASLWCHSNAQSNTTQVDAFTLDEQSITLIIGESRQLHITPANANAKWMESMYPNDAYLTIDENGWVTALKATYTNTVMGGVTNVGAISSDGRTIKTCQVTVLDEGNIIKVRKALPPTDECEWKDVSFSLSDDGVFKAEGTYCGNGAQTDYLNYIVTDQCIFLWFDINYEDSTKMFYPQPFSLELNGCNNQDYYIYYKNTMQVVQPTSTFTRFSIARGWSIGETTNAESISIIKNDDAIYNLNGQEQEGEPARGIYIQNGQKYISR
jgi:hypothetical protein